MIMSTACLPLRIASDAHVFRGNNHGAELVLELVHVPM